MKKLYFFFGLCLAIASNAQIINFPDPNFKAILLAADVTNEIAQNNWPLQDNIKIDINNNGEIEVSEALNVERLNIDNANLTSLSGIENFGNLLFLGCSHNQLTTLDLTFRPYMESIDCSYNLLTEVNFPPIQDEGVVISNNLIQTLTLEGHLGYTFFMLDCRNNPNLMYLFIKNTSIETINVPNYFSPVFLSNCPNLSYICAKDSDLPPIQSALNTNGNSNCILNSLCNGGDLVVDFPDTNLKSRLLQADVTNTIADYNKIDVNNNNEIELSEIVDINYLNISNALISDLTGLRYFNLSILNCSNNSITNLNQLKQQYLEQLDCSYNQLTELTITSPILTDLICANNAIESIDLSHLGFTDFIDFHNNNIATFLPPDYISYLDIRNNNFNGFSIPHFAMEAIFLFGGNPSDELVYNGSWRAPLKMFFSSSTATSVDLSNVPISNYEMINQQPDFYFMNCNLLTSIKLNNGLLSPPSGLNIVNCDSLSSICADEGEVASFNQRLDELNLTNQVQVVTNCQLANSNFESNHTISLAPNPVQNDLQIEVENSTIQTVMIYNVMGQFVLAIPNAQKATSIDVSQLTSGTYFIKIVSDRGSSMAKFIKI